ncbi:hypothetical protein BofuT4_uP031580.1 [Botrytis cinerea T4]|uniref:Uncharacterized protein n=1 Tax=Botryotinia fuckeliana (strain T4) TaxID=999810 RepID=G2Y9K6_BOTF4|nr:hypothetical protein BofuT4_uP031580.1 [Botrytis cinerea T4]
MSWAFNNFKPYSQLMTNRPRAFQHQIGEWGYHC